MHSRFTAHPLQRARALLASPRNGVAEEFRREQFAASWGERVRSTYAEDAPQVAPRKIEQMRRNEVRLLAVLDSVTENANSISGLVASTHTAKTRRVKETMSRTQLAGRLRHVIHRAPAKILELTQFP